uniref:Uncharacterized protein n=1 Tax=Panstrongylus lignarius TaxID=156445 RepID=A0A224Y2Z5_9HEMI
MDLRLILIWQLWAVLINLLQIVSHLFLRLLCAQGLHVVYHLSFGHFLHLDKVLVAVMDMMNCSPVLLTRLTLVAILLMRQSHF